MATADLKRPIANLMGAGSLRTEGQKRGTKYFAGKGGKRKAAKKIKKRVAKRKTTKKRTAAKKVGKRKATRKKKATKTKAKKVGGKRRRKPTKASMVVPMGPELQVT